VAGLNVTAVEQVKPWVRQGMCGYWAARSALRHELR